MARMTRREFLRFLATSFGAVAFDQFISACGQADQLTAFPSPLPDPTQGPQSTPFQPDPTAPPTLAQVEPSAEIPTSEPTAEVTPFSRPDLVVARGGDPGEMVRRALAGFGGMETFVPQGAHVIVKPNICVAYHTYEYAATTNPWVVGAIVKMCLEAGAARVQVMDSPFGGTPEAAYHKSGIAEQVGLAGGELVSMPSFKFLQADIPNGQDLKKIVIYDEALKADVFIDVPIAKHHSLAGLTLGMKNLMGVIRDRPSMHQNLGQRLADLTSLVRPHLTVVDAVRMLMNHGPTGGNLNDVKQMDTVIVSPDIVAADSYAATLFGLQPDQLSYIRAGSAMGLGRSDLESLRIEELAVGV
jgi:uncharacterized protein (DUF362 family)